MNIRLSEKHGLNPTLGICFYCGKETGEIGLLGRMKDDEEAPRYAILSKEPCDECKKVFENNFTLFEADERTGELSGRYWAMPFEKAYEYLEKSIVDGKAVRVTKETALEMGLPYA